MATIVARPATAQPPAGSHAPAGVRFTCSRCGCDVVTDGTDGDAAVHRYMVPNTALGAPVGAMMPESAGGWYIMCPQPGCGHRSFIACGDFVEPPPAVTV
jgi:hypothetical protein